MTSTNGLRYENSVLSTRYTIKYLVRNPNLGRIFNVLGESINEMGDCDCSKFI